MLEIKSRFHQGELTIGIAERDTRANALGTVRLSNHGDDFHLNGVVELGYLGNKNCSMNFSKTKVTVEIIPEAMKFTFEQETNMGDAIYNVLAGAMPEGTASLAKSICDGIIDESSRVLG